MNTKTVIAIAAIVAAAALLAACAGFNFGDLVHTKTPRGIQQSHGVPASLSLNDAVVDYEAWYESVKRDGSQWKSSIDKADELAGLFGTLTMNFAAIGTEAASAHPIGVVAAPLIMGLAGSLLVRKPGDVSKAEAKAQSDAAWDEAFKAATEQLKTGIAATKGVV